MQNTSTQTNAAREAIRHLQSVIPTNIKSKAIASSLDRFGCVERRPMFVNFDLDFQDWHVSPMFFGEENEDNCLSVARAESGILSLL